MAVKVNKDEAVAMLTELIKADRLDEAAAAAAALPLRVTKDAWWAMLGYQPHSNPTKTVAADVWDRVIRYGLSHAARRYQAYVEEVSDLSVDVRELLSAVDQGLMQPDSPSWRRAGFLDSITAAEEMELNFGLLREHRCRLSAITRHPNPRPGWPNKGDEARGRLLAAIDDRLRLKAERMSL